MNEVSKYFNINLDYITENQEPLSYNLYLHNQVNNKYTVFLYANSPLTDEKKDELENIISKGGQLAILKSQKDQFLMQNNLEEKDIPDLNEKEVHQLEINRLERLKQLEGNEDQEFNVKVELAKAITNDDFTNLIKEIKKRLLVLNVNISPTVNLAIELTKELFHNDNSNNRIVALSYCFAILSGIKSENELGNLITASYLHNIGLSQINTHITKRPILGLNDKDKKTYYKHSFLSQHLIRKSGVDISDQCLKIITQHHERANGTGHPHGKKENHIEPLSLVLGASSHIIELSSGFITGTKTKLESIFRYLKNKTMIPGLESEFGDIMKDNFEGIVSEEASKSN